MVISEGTRALKSSRTTHPCLGSSNTYGPTKANNLQHPIQSLRDTTLPVLYGKNFSFGGNPLRILGIHWGQDLIVEERFRVFERLQ